MYKIDLHCHTIAVKGKDQIKRQLKLEDYDSFLENACKNNVKIIAITNHNFIDFEQYNELFKKAKKLNILILLGIEIDFLDKDNNKHAMNIIFEDDLNNIKEWYSLVIKEKEGNLFKPFYYKKLFEVSSFNQMKKIFTIPTSLKQSNNGINFSDIEADELIKLINQDLNIYFYEISNIKKSVNIYEKQNKPYIAGSDSDDVLNIDYSRVSSLPIIINDIESLFKFYKWTLEENIKTPLNFDSKRSNTHIFNNSLSIFTTKIKKDEIKIPIIKGINIIFGSYASGKTNILKSLEKKFCDKFKGKNINIFENNKTGTDFKIVIENCDNKNLNKVNLESMPKIDLNMFLNEDNKSILSAEYSKKNLEKLEKYILDLKKQKYKKLISIKSESDDYIDKIKFNELKTKYEKKNKLISEINLELIQEFLPEIIKENNEIDKDILINFSKLLKIIKVKINLKIKNKLIIYLKSKIYKNCIEKMQKTLNNFNNAESLINDIGLFKLYELKTKIKRELLKINNFELPYSNKEKIDSIENKSFYQKQIFKFNKTETKNQYNLKKKFIFFSKSDLKEKEKNTFFNFIKNIFNELNYSLTLNKTIIDFEIFLNSEMINIKELQLLQNKILDTKFLLEIANVTIDDNEEQINISDGQKKIICLRNYLKVEKEIYLLDEPEASLDNRTIMNSIIEEIIGLGKLGKTVVIITHNPNIAILTKPLNLIYRDIKNNEYKTYIGNYFDKKLINIDFNKNNFCELNFINKSDVLLNLLEGGEEKFIERSEYYGANKIIIRQG